MRFFDKIFKLKSPCVRANHEIVYYPHQEIYEPGPGVYCVTCGRWIDEKV